MENRNTNPGPFTRQAFEEERAERAEKALRLWYTAPTTATPRSAPTADDGDWQNRCLPLGNGHMGAMVAGQVEDEWIQFNEKTLWAGGPAPSRPGYNGGNRPGAFKHLRAVQQLLLQGKTQQAARLAGEKLVGQGPEEGYGGYLNFGWLRIKHRHEGVRGAVATQNYVRDLCLGTATATVSYTLGQTGYVRQYLASYPHRVVAVRLRCTRPGGLHLWVGLCPAQTGAAVRVEGRGVAIGGALQDNGLAYHAAVRIVATGGRVEKEGEGVAVSGADEVVLLLCAATNYADTYPAYRSGQSPAKLVGALLQKAGAAGWQGVYQAHLQDYAALFSRVALHLGPAHKYLPTDVRLAASRQGRQDAGFAALLFQYGRYLLIASSRAGSLPANLQGVWNETDTPPWGGDYHLNINLQMNYWPAYTTALAECALPLVRYAEALQPPGSVAANAYFGTGGAGQPGAPFCTHTQNTPFGWACPGWEFTWGWCPSAAAWLLQSLWDYYAFTGDTEMLRTRVYPLLRAAALFWQQVLVQNPADGLYYAAPAYSPEHGPVTLGNTYEHVLVKELFSQAAKAAEILGADAPLRAAWLHRAAHMRGEEVGQSGQVKEWFCETTLGSVPHWQKGHRHLSHLVGLYPGGSIHPGRPALFKAAEVSLRERGLASTGWGLAHRLCAWARLANGEEAHAALDMFVQTGLHQNLLCTHPPFQIDGNLGYTAGVAEMLLQSHLGALHPLPALPKAWQSGQVSGLVARGNVRVSLVWRGGRLRSMRVTPAFGGAVKIKLPAGCVGVALAGGGRQTPMPLHQGHVTPAPAAGQTAVLCFAYAQNTP